MIEWSLVAKIAGGGFGIAILVLIILLVVIWLVGLARPKSQAKGEEKE